MRGWVLREAWAFRRACLPHSGNNYKKKSTLTALLFVWVVLEVGNALLAIQPPVALEWLRPVVIAIVARAHGIEVSRLSIGTEGGDGGKSEKTDGET